MTGIQKRSWYSDPACPCADVVEHRVERVFHRVSRVDVIKQPCPTYIPQGHKRL